VYGNVLTSFWHDFMQRSNAKIHAKSDSSEHILLTDILSLTGQVKSSGFVGFLGMYWRLESLKLRLNGLLLVLWLWFACPFALEYHPT
jgi:hypothetical protein